MNKIKNSFFQKKVKVYQLGISVINGDVYFEVFVLILYRYSKKTKSNTISMDLIILLGVMCYTLDYIREKIMSIHETVDTFPVCNLFTVH